MELTHATVGLFFSLRLHLQIEIEKFLPIVAMVATTNIASEPRSSSLNVFSFRYYDYFFSGELSARETRPYFFLLSGNVLQNAADTLLFAQLGK